LFDRLIVDVDLPASDRSDYHSFQLSKTSALSSARSASPRFDEKSPRKIMLQRFDGAVGLDALGDEAAGCGDFGVDLWH
jgi:hypothetical protein